MDALVGPIAVAVVVLIGLWLIFSIVHIVR